MSSAPSSSRTLLGPSSPFAAPSSTSTDLWHRLEARRPSPLRFALFLSRRPNATLCPCLQADLYTSSSTFYTVTRILDPEHRVPYITLSPILHAAGLTLVQGLLRFHLSPSSYDLSLAGLEPWDDLWTSLPVARSIASALGFGAALASMLDPKTTLAWSLDELELRLSHNWRVPQQWVDSTAYSTDAMIKRGFDRVQMLPRGQQVTTLVSGEMRSRVVREAEERRGSTEGKLHERLVRWSAQVCAGWQDVVALGDEKGTRLGSMLEDLRDVVLAPTSTDVLEWLQLICPLLDHTSGQSSVHKSAMLAPLTLAQLADLRSKEPTLGTLFLSASQDDIAGVRSRLDSIIRSKLACLHHMNLVSLSHLASHCDADTDLEKRIAQHNTASISNYSTEILPAQPTSMPAAASRADEIAHLDAKLDGLASKLDLLLTSQHRTQASGSMSAVQPEKDRQTRATLQVAGETPLSMDPPTSTADVDPVSPLRRVETTPSLLVTILSVVLAFIAIKSTVN